VQSAAAGKQAGKAADVYCAVGLPGCAADARAALSFDSIRVEGIAVYAGGSAAAYGFNRK
jgi:hypothetical protein